VSLLLPWHFFLFPTQKRQKKITIQFLSEVKTLAAKISQKHIGMISAVEVYAKQ